VQVRFVIALRHLFKDGPIFFLTDTHGLLGLFANGYLCSDALIKLGVLKDIAVWAEMIWRISSRSGVKASAARLFSM